MTFSNVLKSLLNLCFCSGLVLACVPQPTPVEQLNTVEAETYIQQYLGNRVLDVSLNYQAEFVAGMDEAQFADGQGNQAAFNYPWHCVQGNDAVLIADRFNHRIRALKAGVVSTVLGQRTPGLKDGFGEQVQFNNPQYLLMDPEGVLWISDTGNHALRKMTPEGQVQTVSTAFKVPNGLALFGNGDIGIADAGRNQILRWRKDSHALTVVAGDGTQGDRDGEASQAQFFSPRDIAIDGETVFVADSFNHRIRKIEGTLVTTLAGQNSAGETDGAGTAARFNEPSQIDFEGEGQLIVLDFISQKLRLLSRAGDVKSVRLNGDFEHLQSFCIGTESIWLSDARRHEIWRF